MLLAGPAGRLWTRTGLGKDQTADWVRPGCCILAGKKRESDMYAGFLTSRPGSECRDLSAVMARDRCQPPPHKSLRRQRRERPLLSARRTWRLTRRQTALPRNGHGRDGAGSSYAVTAAAPALLGLRLRRLRVSEPGSARRLRVCQHRHSHSAVADGTKTAVVPPPIQVLPYSRSAIPTPLPAIPCPSPRNRIQTGVLLTCWDALIPAHVCCLSVSSTDKREMQSRPRRRQVQVGSAALRKTSASPAVPRAARGPALAAREQASGPQGRKESRRRLLNGAPPSSY